MNKPLEDISNSAIQVRRKRPLNVDKENINDVTPLISKASCVKTNIDGKQLLIELISRNRTKFTAGPGSSRPVDMNKSKSLSKLLIQ